MTSKHFLTIWLKSIAYTAAGAVSIARENSIKRNIAALALFIFSSTSYAAHTATVVGTATKIWFGYWEYRYSVTNNATSTDDIELVYADKTTGAPVVERLWRGDRNRGWDFFNNADNFGWDHSTPFAIVGRDIGPGKTGEFVAKSANGPTTGNFYTDDEARLGSLAINPGITVPDTVAAPKQAMRNTPGGSGTYNAATGQWDYEYELTAIDTVSAAILDFSPDIDLTNLVLSLPGWNVFHVGFDSNIPTGFLGDVSDPDLQGLLILYADAGSALLPGQFLDLSLSSSFAPGLVYTLNGDALSGPSEIPEPGTLSLMGLLLGTIGVMRQRL